MENYTTETLIARLQQTKGNWRVICAETGLGYSWLTKFAQRQIPNPGIKRLEILRQHFERTAA